MNESLSFGVAGDRHRQIGISCEPRFSTRGNGEAADQGEGNVGINEVGVNLTKRRFERCHASLVAGTTERPEQSPASAPGRVSSHS